MTPLAPALILALMATIVLSAAENSAAPNGHSHGFEVYLPHACGHGGLMAAQEDHPHIAVQIAGQGEQFINGFRHDADLSSAVAHLVQSKQHNEIYFIADAALSYGSVMRVVSDLKTADPDIVIALATQEQTRLQGDPQSHQPLPRTMDCFYPPAEDAPARARF